MRLEGEQRERYAREFPSALEIADREGIDLTLLVANLEKSPTERVEAHDRALNLILEMRKGLQPDGN